MRATKNLIDEGKWRLCYRVCGTQHGDRFLSFPGVARLLNFYPIGDETSEDGVVNVASDWENILWMEDKHCVFFSYLSKKYSTNK